MAAKDVLGRSGEDLAAGYLEDAGMRVVERNWRCREGEIDIVAVDGAELVVCEVKTRRGLAFGSPLEAVTPVKLARLRRLAGRWLLEHEHPRLSGIRIDVIGILRQRGSAPVIEHVRGVVP